MYDDFLTNKLFTTALKELFITTEREMSWVYWKKSIIFLKGILKCVTQPMLVINLNM